jgi:prevent-host-death family protein
MDRINTHDAKTRLSALLAKVEETGAAYLICRNGRPVAELRPWRRPVTDRLRTIEELRPLHVADDFDPTAPLSEEEWPEASR